MASGDHVIGPLDDILVVALALRYAARAVPREVLSEAWPAEPRLLDRLLPIQSAKEGSQWPNVAE